jgi:hypothetical protein
MESKKNTLIQVPAEELEILLAASAFILSPLTDEDKADERVRKAFFRLCGALYVSTEGNENTAVSGVMQDDGFVYFKFGGFLHPTLHLKDTDVKIAAIKAHRNIFDSGLLDAKKAIESDELLKFPLMIGVDGKFSYATTENILKGKASEFGIELLIFDDITPGKHV